MSIVNAVLIGFSNNYFYGFNRFFKYQDNMIQMLLQLNTAMIHVISTSANLDNNFEMRKQQYIAGLESIKHYYRMDPYIIEGARATDYLGEHFVSEAQHSANKSNNEIITIANFFREYAHGFQDSDYIIKTTLRYELYSSCFLDYIKDNPGYDAYGKYSSDIYGAGDINIHTFLFCMTYRCWQEFLSGHFDPNTHPDYPTETQVSAYLRTQNTRYVDQLGIIARPWNHHPRIYNT